ncbi:unnamed protein product [Closterium sp. NIES-65]|nr:unnamed protein product [Closterium sp. NIES-65]
MESVSLAAASAASTATLFNGKKQVLLSSRGNACNPAFIARVERRMSTPALRTAPRRVAGQVSASADRTVVAAATSPGGQAPISALVFDCDGVILESEDLHRRAYNAAFAHFAIRCPGENAIVDWTTEFYDVLQNKIGGGKPKMRWYFNKNGWPHSSFLPAPPATDADKDVLIDTLQVPVRPGVLELIDEARQRGLLVAVCSAATKSSVVFQVDSIFSPHSPTSPPVPRLSSPILPPVLPPLSFVSGSAGGGVFCSHQELSRRSAGGGVFCGHQELSRLHSHQPAWEGDDVPKKKPDPTIYKIAAQRLGVPPSSCLVVEDSVIGLQAALGAGMLCVITYTPSTKSQDFTGAVTAFDDLGGVSLDKLISACSAVVA